MPGYAWHIFTFCIIGIFLIGITYRTLAIIRLPAHLRWELAPIPREKGKGQYGGSYLEEYEWWNKQRHKSHIASLIYMLKEIFLLRGIWINNRSLWPLTFLFHTGIYLFTCTLVWQAITAILFLIGISLQVLYLSLRIVSILAFGGYVLGSLGSISLILKRTLDPNLRPFNTVSKYFNLLFLGAVFISGGYAWLYSGDFISEINFFIQSLITFDPGITISFPLSLHLGISSLFLIYLPFTDMIHFIAKYFTYHAIRWDDKPKDEKLEGELNDLLTQPVTWSAIHIKADGNKSWTDIAATETSDEEAP